MRLAAWEKNPAVPCAEPGCAYGFVVKAAKSDPAAWDGWLHVVPRDDGKRAVTGLGPDLHVPRPKEPV